MQKRTYNWDILALTRFFLAFVVISDHALIYTHNLGPLEWIRKFGAFDAVLGFLLISGFSIGKSIQQRRRNFFKRRIRRIYPVYLLGISVAYLAVPEILTFKLSLIIAANIFFLNQLFITTAFGGIPVWTLALEVWLYILAPVLLRLSYKSLIAIIYISFLCYCFYTCGRSLFHWPYYAGTMWGLNLVLLSYAWVLGYALAIHKNKKSGITKHIAAILTIHLVLSCSIQTIHRIKHDQIDNIFTQDIWEFAGKAICLSVTYYALIFSSRIKSLSIKAQKAFQFLGNISYPLYIVHMPAYILCTKWGLNNWIIFTLAALVLSIVVFWLSDFYIRYVVQRSKPEPLPEPSDIKVLATEGV